MIISRLSSWEPTSGPLLQWTFCVLPELFCEWSASPTSFPFGICFCQSVSGNYYSSESRQSQTAICLLWLIVKCLLQAHVLGAWTMADCRGWGLVGKISSWEWILEFKFCCCLSSHCFCPDVQPFLSFHWSNGARHEPQKLCARIKAPLVTSQKF